MKHTKRIASLLLALIMVFALATGAMAATINIKGGAIGAEYSAWKLLNATDGGDGKFAYTVNEAYRSILQEVTDTETDTGIVEYIYNLADDAEAIRKLADAVYAKVKTMSSDATTTTDKFENVAQGYYLIAETKLGENGEDKADDTYSLVMLDTAGKDEVTVNTKEDVPEVEKKVKEGTAWQDAADAAKDQVVEFQLEGTVSSKYDDYKTYYYAFHDTMSNGLTLDEESFKVYVDSSEITNGYTVVTTGLNDGCTFEVRFDDLKEIAAVKNDSIITVEYKATLNEDAIVGDAGNDNKVKLEYSNNPYDQEKPTTGTTPDDIVTVFTYTLNVNKVDKDGKALEGAGFTLYKQDENDEWVAVGKEITDVTTFTFDRLDSGKYKLEETTVPDGYNKVDDIFFDIVATYDTESNDPQLTELKVVDEDGKVILDENNEAVFAIANDMGSITTNVVNLTGVELPSTGGIGTTIFYILGGVLVVGAVVLLVTKKRMSTEQ